MTEAPKRRTQYPLMLTPHIDRLIIRDDETRRMLERKGMRWKMLGPSYWEMWLPYPEGSPELLERQKR